MLPRKRTSKTLCGLLKSCVKPSSRNEESGGVGVMVRYPLCWGWEQLQVCLCICCSLDRHWSTLSLPSVPTHDSEVMERMVPVPAGSAQVTHSGRGWRLWILALSRLAALAHTELQLCLSSGLCWHCAVSCPGHGIFYSSTLPQAEEPAHFQCQHWPTAPSLWIRSPAHGWSLWYMIQQRIHNATQSL